MLRLCFTAFIVLLLCNGIIAHEFSPGEKYYDQTGRKHYLLALHITSPFGMASKVGAGLELRTGDFSYIGAYKMFYGAFGGKQYGLEMEKFFWNKTGNQYFSYFKGLFGDTTRFINTKLSMFGHTQDIQVGPEMYFGGGIGVGRRYNFNMLFIDWQLGLKYVFLDGDFQSYDNEYERARQSMFRLFRFTGPGSILEAHLTFGLQL